MSNSFSVSRLPRIEFAAGALLKVPELILEYGTKLLLITGANSMQRSSYWGDLVSGLQDRQIQWYQATVADEPSPDLVDGIVSEFYDKDIDVVVAIGGGSVMDAAKAIAGLLPFGNSVMDHLEGVGRGIPYKGPAKPFIAVPTTAGTGSEATKNAVLSRRGADGFKKSFRHDTLVPEYAVIDPLLLKSCPKKLIAANGMDALTQLVESYVSIRPNPFTSALVWDGLVAMKNGFMLAAEGGNGARYDVARHNLAYGALLSGIGLAHTGLGSVHGLAAPLGAFYPAPHGEVCGTLLAVATEVNIRALEERLPQSDALVKYANLGRLLFSDAEDDEQARKNLINGFSTWSTQLNMPPLETYGVTSADIPKIVANSRGSSMTTNPIVLTDDEVAEIIQRRL